MQALEVDEVTAGMVSPLVVSVGLHRNRAIVTRDMLIRRPDVAQAERQVAAANAAIGVQVAGYYPQLTINATSGLEYAKAHTANKVLAVIKKPTVLDAAGHEVPVTLKAEGDTFTVAVSPGESAVFPVTALIACAPRSTS